MSKKSKVILEEVVVGVAVPEPVVMVSLTKIAFNEFFKLNGKVYKKQRAVNTNNNKVICWRGPGYFDDIALDCNTKVTPFTPNRV